MFLLCNLLTILDIINTKENAVLFILCRNSDIDSLKKTLTTFEKTFNLKYGYPYVILNNEDFTEEFKNEVKSVVSTDIQFGKLSEDEWGPPNWIDLEKVKIKMQEYEDNNVLYGGSINYRNMCRFFSGKFYKNPLVEKYEFFWRLEPGVDYLCQMNYDPFEFMKKNKKMYGFVIAIHETMSTISTLWSDTQYFMVENRELLSKNGLNASIKDGEYNGCHYWTNFEIANFNFFRSEVYEKYFEFLDKCGGFYYERWGDAPVHSLAVDLFLNKEDVHFFDDIGYRHEPFMHCPRSPSRQVECECDLQDSIELNDFSCVPAYTLETLYGIIV